MKKLIAMMLMLASVFFIACDDDEDDKKLSKEETKTEIIQLSTDLSDKLTEMTESDGMVAMEALANLPDPFGSTSKSNENYAVLNNIQKYLLPYNYVKKSTEKSAFETASFDFDRWVGTYTWNNTIEVWIPVFGVPSDKIIIIFPADSTDMDNNNATITIHNYDEILINYDEVEIDYEYLPTDIDADLYIDQIKIIDIDLTATWDNDGEPTSLNAIVYLVPFEFTGTFSQTSTDVSIDFAINYDGAQFFSTGVGATWANAGDSIPSNIDGYLQFFNVKLQADIDLADIMIVMTNYFDGNSDYTTEAELLDAINAEVDAYVTVDGNWAADIELGIRTVLDDDGEEEDDMDILFVYADGTSESAIPYFEALGNEMEEFFGSLEDYYEGW